MPDYFKCVVCHNESTFGMGLCRCGGKYKPVVKLRALTSGRCHWNPSGDLVYVAGGANGCKIGKCHAPINTLINGL